MGTKINIDFFCLLKNKIYNDACMITKSMLNPLIINAKSIKNLLILYLTIYKHIQRMCNFSNFLLFWFVQLIKACHYSSLIMSWSKREIREENRNSICLSLCKNLLPHSSLVPSSRPLLRDCDCNHDQLFPWPFAWTNHAKRKWLS